MEIEQSLTEIIDEKTNDYGVKVLHIGTKTIQLPNQLERAMASVAESEKSKVAKIIDAQANLETAYLFRDSANELGKNTVSFQLQYFDVLRKIASEHKTTLVLPSSVIGGLLKDK